MPSKKADKPSSDKAIEPTVVTKQSPKSTRPDIKLPIALMAWPIVATIIAIAGYAIVNLAIGDSNPALVSALNIILFLIGAAAIFFGPISFIGGLILLVISLQRR